MGIQDRDYWRERYSSNEDKEPPEGQASGKVYANWGGREPALPAKAAPLSHSPERTLQFLTVVSVIAVAGFFAYRWHADHSAQIALERAHQMAQKTALEQQQAAANSRALAVASEQRLAAERQRQAQKSSEQFAQFQRQDAEHRQRDKKKEDAWRRFYKPSADCSSDAFVECGNAYIRARRAFEAQYKDD